MYYFLYKWSVLNIQMFVNFYFFLFNIASDLIIVDVVKLFSPFFQIIFKNLLMLRRVFWLMKGGRSVLPTFWPLQMLPMQCKQFAHNYCFIIFSNKIISFIYQNFGAFFLPCQQNTVRLSANLHCAHFCPNKKSVLQIALAQKSAISSGAYRF